MSLTIVLIIALILSLGFHFIGVYVNSKKIVWTMLAILWAGSINIALSEIKPKGYEDIQEIKGKYLETDKLIEESMPEISVYEMLRIKKSFNEAEKKK
ncbi:hypothetical protein KKG72_00895 [bacterium]|nr:hypothetical protein [bacterium]MBU1994957.1 hypothetical protein [bacterium]